MRRPFPADRLGGLLRADRGLSAPEVDERRERHGANDIVEAVGHPVAALARDTIRDPMIWFLVGTGLLYLLLGETAEAVVLLASILPLVGMDAVLHRRTQASTRGLRGLLAERAHVVRDGAERDLPVAEVVVGDLCTVRTNEVFPADGIIVAGDALQVDESALTGESYPVRKRPVTGEPRGDELLDEGNWGMAGTRLLTGVARVRVAWTGQETLYGGIVHMAAEGGKQRTHLQRSVERLVSALVVAAGALCVFLAAVRLWQGYGWVDAVISATTLAVAALPEEFPVVLTVFLGVGVFRLARRHALVRRAVAVESIGRVTCICSDKTGTVTEGVLRIAAIEPAPPATYAPLQVASAASRRSSGDPLDRAILDAAAARAIGDRLGEALATYPFTEDRRRETAVLRTPGGARAFCKGAPETLLAMSTLAGAELEHWRARVRALAGEGMKVIACGYRDLGAHDLAEEPDRQYVFAGLIGIADPLREGVAESVRWCRAAGVRVLLITGDHADTARAVARQMELARSPAVVTGDDLERHGADLASYLAGVDVVARALPSQKLAIVNALRAAGEVVAVTGDGVNDVPALRSADVGIGMGMKGARSAREVSSIVLMDDDFRSIVAAIGEGRVLFQNLRRSFQYLLLVHIPLVLTASLLPLAGFPLLYLPVHIVWLELVIHPTALLVFQDRRQPVAEPPLAPVRDAAILTRGQWVIVIAAGAALAAGIALACHRGLSSGHDAAHARAMAVAILTLASALLAASLSGLATRTSRIVAAATLLTSVVLLQTAAVAGYLEVRPLAASDWGLALAVAAAPVGAAALLLRPRLGDATQAPRRRADRAIGAPPAT